MASRHQFPRPSRKDLQGDPDALLRESEAAAFLGFTRRALQNWRQSNKGPRFIRISSRAVRYRRRDLIEWMERNTRKPAADTRRKGRS